MLIKKIIPIILALNIPLIASAIISVGEDLPKFELINQNNNTVTHKDCLGKKTILNFIFTRCCAPTQCPAATEKLAELQATLKKQNNPNIQFITISFDPKHDTPKRLKLYAQAYEIDEDNFHFLTGDQNTISNLMKAFGILTINADHTIQHTMRTVVINEKGKIAFSKQGTRWTNDELIDVLKK